MAKTSTPPDTDDIGELVDWALKETGLTQYKLAQRMADLRGTALASQDQALRRIRRLGQYPTEDVAATMSHALKPDLNLPDDFFYRPRSQAMQLREATLAALDEIEELRARVEELEAEQDRLQNLLHPPRPTKRADGAPKRRGTS